jgi:hypothetical protein
VHKERSCHQGRNAHGNDNEGHAADVSDPGATEVHKANLEYAGSSDGDGDDDYDSDCEAALTPPYRGQF